MDFYKQMFNPNYINPQAYHDTLLRHYQFEQDKGVCDAVKAMHDLCEAISKLDEQHKQMAFAGCIVEIAKASSWQ